ncbi:hypothetical protein KCU90_g2120, partial [Aureobasidium melanogenum]
MIDPAHRHAPPQTLPHGDTKHKHRHEQHHRAELGRVNLMFGHKKGHHAHIEHRKISEKIGTQRGALANAVEIVDGRRTANAAQRGQRAAHCAGCEGRPPAAIVKPAPAADVHHRGGKNGERDEPAQFHRRERNHRAPAHRVRPTAHALQRGREMDQDDQHTGFGCGNQQPEQRRHDKRAAESGQTFCHARHHGHQGQTSQDGRSIGNIHKSFVRNGRRIEGQIDCYVLRTTTASGKGRRNWHAKRPVIDARGSFVAALLAKTGSAGVAAYITRRHGQRDTPDQRGQQRQADRQIDRHANPGIERLDRAHQGAEDCHAKGGAGLPARVEHARRDPGARLVHGRHQRGGRRRRNHTGPETDRREAQRDTPIRRVVREREESGETQRVQQEATADESLRAIRPVQCARCKAADRHHGGDERKHGAHANHAHVPAELRALDQHGDRCAERHDSEQLTGNVHLPVRNVRPHRVDSRGQPGANQRDRHIHQKNASPAQQMNQQTTGERPRRHRDAAASGPYADRTGSLPRDRKSTVDECQRARHQ